MKPIFSSLCLVFAASLLMAGQVNAQDENGAAAAKESPRDAAITAQIYAGLSAEQPLNGSLINVSTKNGVVLLRGITPTPQAKAAADRVASTTPGVHLVQDALEVGKIPVPKAPGDGGD